MEAQLRNKFISKQVFKKQIGQKLAETLSFDFNKLQITLPRNSVVYKQGDSPDYVYIIKEGSAMIFRDQVKLEKLSSNRMKTNYLSLNSSGHQLLRGIRRVTRHKVSLLSAGQIFGEEELVQGLEARFFGCMTLSKCVLMRVTRECIRAHMKNHPKLRTFIHDWAKAKIKKRTEFLFKAGLLKFKNDDKYQKEFLNVWSLQMQKNSTEKSQINRNVDEVEKKKEDVQLRFKKIDYTLLNHKMKNKFAQFEKIRRKINRIPDKYKTKKKGSSQARQKAVVRFKSYSSRRSNHERNPGKFTSSLMKKWRNSSEDISEYIIQGRRNLPKLKSTFTIFDQETNDRLSIREIPKYEKARYYSNKIRSKRGFKKSYTANPGTRIASEILSSINKTKGRYRSKYPKKLRKRKLPGDIYSLKHNSLTFESSLDYILEDYNAKEKDRQKSEKSTMRTKWDSRAESIEQRSKRKKLRGVGSLLSNSKADKSNSRIHNQSSILQARHLSSILPTDGHSQSLMNENAIVGLDGKTLPLEEGSAVGVGGGYSFRVGEKRALFNKKNNSDVMIHKESAFGVLLSLKEAKQRSNLWRSEDPVEKSITNRNNNISHIPEIEVEIGGETLFQNPIDENPSLTPVPSNRNKASQVLNSERKGRNLVRKIFEFENDTYLEGPSIREKIILLKNSLFEKRRKSA